MIPWISSIHTHTPTHTGIIHNNWKVHFHATTFDMSMAFAWILASGWIEWFFEFVRKIIEFWKISGKSNQLPQRFLTNACKECSSVGTSGLVFFPAWTIFSVRYCENLCDLTFAFKWNTDGGVIMFGNKSIQIDFLNKLTRVRNFMYITLLSMYHNSNNVTNFQ